MMLSAATSPLSILADPQATLPDLMGAVLELGAQTDWRQEQSIGLASNVTLNLMDVFLRRHAFLHGTDLKVHVGGYDDYLGDIRKFVREGLDHIFLLPFFDNLMPSFEAQIKHLSDDLILAKRQEVTARLAVALEVGASFANIYLARFHRYSSPGQGTDDDRISRTIEQFNEELVNLAETHANVRLVDLGVSVSNVGYREAFDDRFYAKAKAPYKALALNEIAKDLASITRGYGSQYFKAIILDCDNTLWGGVVGEDLLGGIKLDPFDFPGNVFWRIQNELLALERSGALICLCSKNNPEDVEEVLEKHPHMLLKNELIIAKKVNWNDKVTNIKEISEELNIGLDSFVFIDDSDFECQLIRDQLPMVKTIQVPKVLSEYVRVMEDIGRLFPASKSAVDGQSKTEQYKNRNAGIADSSKFETHEDYLRSLDIRVHISGNHFESVPRISELTQKSNQFNLTTQRYSEGDIERMMQSEDHVIYSFDVTDKFGACGLTGILVAKYETNVLKIDSFLMSCRVLGRGVEFSIWEFVFEEAKKRGCDRVEALYIPTVKNTQVRDFFERLGLDIDLEEATGGKQYSKNLAELTDLQNDWIELIYA